MKRGEIRGIVFATLLLFVFITGAFAVGRFPISLLQLAQVLLSKVTRTPSGVSAAVETVIWQIRGPRIIAAVLSGSVLAVAGAAFQGLFLNPLVSPDILGASSRAALGAVLGNLSFARARRGSIDRKSGYGSEVDHRWKIEKWRRPLRHLWRRGSAHHTFRCGSGPWRPAAPTRVIEYALPEDARSGARRCPSVFAVAAGSASSARLLELPA
jgi:hypothetical protein